MQLNLPKDCETPIRLDWTQEVVPKDKLTYEWMEDLAELDYPVWVMLLAKDQVRQRQKNGKVERRGGDDEHDEGAGGLRGKQHMHHVIVKVKQWEVGPADGREPPIRGPPLLDSDPSGCVHQGGALDLDWGWPYIILQFTGFGRALKENSGLERTNPNKRTIGSVGDLPYGDGSLEGMGCS